MLQSFEATEEEKIYITEWMSWYDHQIKEAITVHTKNVSSDNSMLCQYVIGLPVNIYVLV